MSRARERMRAIIGSQYEAERPQIPPVIVRPQPLDVIRRITRQNALDPRLEPTDRHMQRWAVSSSSSEPALAAIAWDVSTASRFRLTPLPDTEAVIIDRIVHDAPRVWRLFVKLWYKSDVPVDVIAADLGLKRRTLYDERRLVLAYLLGQMRAAGLHIPGYQWV
jgi:hypothetical protein